LVGIAGVSAFLGLPAKAEVNPNPSIFGEYPYNQANVAQANPGAQPVQTTPGTVQQDNDNDINNDNNGVQRRTTPGITQPTQQDTTTPGITQPTQPDTTTPGITQPVQDTTTPGVTQPVQDTTTPGTTPGTVQQDNDVDDNGVRALW
jgi:hypothetical protein